MNIALIGYGKMGHTIEAIAAQRGHQVVLRISSANRHEMTRQNLQHADVAIEFTNPDAARDNIMLCLNAGVNTICGTTGWNQDIPEVEQNVLNMNLGFLHTSNFSIGVNMLFEVNKLVASLMNSRSEYDVSITETHHLQKKDAPSGTAITLAEQILQLTTRKNGWRLYTTDQDELDHRNIHITANRVEHVPGTHKVLWSSPTDDIEITHTAHNRNGFALGAVLAAEFIAGKQGIFTMKDVLFDR